MNQPEIVISDQAKRKFERPGADNFEDLRALHEQGAAVATARVILDGRTGAAREENQQAVLEAAREMVGMRITPFNRATGEECMVAGLPQDIARLAEMPQVMGIDEVRQGQRKVRRRRGGRAKGGAGEAEAGSE